MRLPIMTVMFLLSRFFATLGAAGAADPDALWSSEDVAAFLGVPVSTVQYWAWKGTGPKSYRIGRRRKYRPSEVRKWADAHVEQNRTPSPIPRRGKARK